MRLDAGNWRATVARYQKADARRAVTQLLTTLVPLAAMMYLMYLSLSRSYWLTLALAVPTAGFLVRTFIIMHDCGHGSFLPSQTCQRLVGFVTGVLTAHALRASGGTSTRSTTRPPGDLDRRGHGDIATLTVDEYLALGLVGRFRYRLYRNPAAAARLGPLYMMVVQRVPGRASSSGSAQTSSVWTDQPRASRSLVTDRSADPRHRRSVLLVYLPVAYLAAERRRLALLRAAPVRGRVLGAPRELGLRDGRGRWAARTCKLPRVLQWFTGNIGLHHVHHLGAAHPELPPAAGARREPDLPQAHRRSASPAACGCSASRCGTSSGNG